MGKLFVNTNSNESTQVEIGAKAPDFVLRGEKGEEWRLSEQMGHVTALLFYPKNENLYLRFRIP